MAASPKSAIDCMAARCESYSSWWSSTIRTARSRTSGEYLGAEERACLCGGEDVPWDGSLSGAGLPTALGAGRSGGHRAESEAAGELPGPEAAGSGPGSARTEPPGYLAERVWPPWPQLRQLAPQPRHHSTTATPPLPSSPAQKEAFFNGLLDPRRFHAVYFGAARITGKPRLQGRKLRRTAATAPKRSVARVSAALPVPILFTAQPVSPDRAQIRAALLEFVGELSRSDDRVHLVRVISRVDDFVSRALA